MYESDDVGRIPYPVVGCPFRSPVTRRARPMQRHEVRVSAREEVVEDDQGPQLRIDLGDLYTESGQTLRGSFSAVSKPNFVDEVERKTSRKTSKIQKNRKKMKNVYVKIT